MKPGLLDKFFVK